MNEIIAKNRCTGCSACVNICSKNAIKMLLDREGFLYPIIDKKKCINCGMCKNICPVLNTNQNYSLNECYLGYAIDENSINNSSSGGIFPLIANNILDNNGIVIGASFDENNNLKHIAIKKKDDLEKLKGSKYLQSDLNDIFKYIKDNIAYNRILFVGTPCQVAGLKAYLKNDYDNLICIDLVCHGVPSLKLFKKYTKELELKNGKLIKYVFRDKSTGWDNYSNRIVFENKTIYEKADKNNYMKLYLSDIALRDSCFNCNFKLGNKYSDITLGDFWGIQEKYSEMYNPKGVSAIIINTKKGIDIFNSINKNIKYHECTLNDIIEGNPCLKESRKKLNKREEFFNEIDELSFSKLTKKYKNKTSLLKRIINKMKLILKK